MRPVRVALLALAACAAAAAPAGAADAGGWTQFGGDLARTGFAPSEASLTPANAPGLREAWSVPLGGVLDAEPAVTGGAAPLAVAASENGVVAAVDLATGAVRWRRRLPTRKTTCADLPGGRYGISTTPVLDGDRAYVVAADGRAYALSLATGRTLPGWPVPVLAQPAVEHEWGAMALWRGRLYVPAASACDNVFYHGEIAALDVTRRRRVGRWSAVPHGHGGGVWAWGGVALDTARGRLYAATANAQSRDETRGDGEHLVELDTRLHLVAANHPRVDAHNDSDFGGHPVLMDAAGCPPLLTVLHKSGALLLYDRRRIGRGPLQRIATSDPASHAGFGTYAWSAAQRTLYLASGIDGALPHGMIAFTLGSDCRLHVRWQRRVEEGGYHPGPPTLDAGGLVVWGGGTSGRVYLADARTGALVRTLGPVGGPVYGGVTLADGMVLVPSWDGALHAFALPAG